MRSLSSWESRLPRSSASSVQDLSNEDKAMVARNLHVELSELAGLVNEKKDNFALDELRRSFRYYDMALKTISFEYLVSVTSLADSHTYPETEKNGIKY